MGCDSLGGLAAYRIKNRHGPAVWPEATKSPNLSETWEFIYFPGSVLSQHEWDNASGANFLDLPTNADL